MTSESSENRRREHRWPTNDDRLFVDAAWGHGAPISTDSDERSYRLPMAYKRAGDLLVQRASTDLADRRNIVYPALFCYRQSIELFLKCLIGRCSQRSEQAPNTHKLDRLWDIFEDLTRERGSQLIGHRRGETVGARRGAGAIGALHSRMRPRER